MSVKISPPQAQIPLYINGALQNEARDAFEQTLKRDPELKQECKEFHEIESVIDVIEGVTDQHFEHLFTRIQANARFEPPTQPQTSTAAEEESTVIMRREDGIDKAGNGKASDRAIEKTISLTSPPEISQQNRPATAKFDNESDVKHEKSTAEVNHQSESKHEHEDEEHIAFFSKEHLADFFTSARLAWGVVIAQFALLITLWLSSTGNGITAIGTDGRPITDIATINVVFADSATQKEIRELLASVDAQIANGPTSIGLYTIYIKGNEVDAKFVIDTLKKSTLILLAEPSFT
jgi:hypothetical protein